MRPGYETPGRDAPGRRRTGHVEAPAGHVNWSMDTVEVGQGVDATGSRFFGHAVERRTLFMSSRSRRGLPALSPRAGPGRPAQTTPRSGSHATCTRTRLLRSCRGSFQTPAATWACTKKPPTVLVGHGPPPDSPHSHRARHPDRRFTRWRRAIRQFLRTGASTPRSGHSWQQRRYA